MAHPVPPDHHAVPAAATASAPRDRAAGLLLFQRGPGAVPPADPDGYWPRSGCCLSSGARRIFGVLSRRHLTGPPAPMSGGPAGVHRPDRASPQPGGPMSCRGLRPHGGPLDDHPAQLFRVPVFPSPSGHRRGSCGTKSRGRGAVQGSRNAAPRALFPARGGAAPGGAVRRNSSRPPRRCPAGPPRCSGWTTWNASSTTNTSPWSRTSCRCRLWALPLLAVPAGCWEAAPGPGPAAGLRLPDDVTTEWTWPCGSSPRPSGPSRLARVRRRCSTAQCSTAQRSKPRGCGAGPRIPGPRASRRRSTVADSPAFWPLRASGRRGNRPGRAHWSDDPSHILGVLANYLRLDDPGRRRTDSSARRNRRPTPVERLAAARGSGAAARGAGAVSAETHPDVCRPARLPKYCHVVEALAAVRGQLQAVERSWPSPAASAQRTMYSSWIWPRPVEELAEPLQHLVARRRDSYAQNWAASTSPGAALGRDGTRGAADRTAGGERPEPRELLTGLPRRRDSRPPGPRHPGAARRAPGPGEILVAPSTTGLDALFLTAGGLVMEIGGPTRTAPSSPGKPGFPRWSGSRKPPR